MSSFTATRLAEAVTSVEGAGVAFAAAIRLLASGRPLSVDRLAGEIGWAPERMAALLDRFPNVERDATGALEGFGLTLRPTAHSFVVDGRKLYTWCALDALFIPVILKQSTHVRSVCHATGRPIHMRVSVDGVRVLEPATG